MNLVIDLGNTSAKIGFFSSGKLKSHFVYPALTLKELKKVLGKTLKLEQVLLSSVIAENKELESFLNKNFLLLKLNSTTPLPVKKKYQTPETLGNDRIAAAVGANHLFPKQNILAIDAGTCIKYDFVNSKNEYLGGNISPGIDMRYKALNTFTAKLPLVAKKNDSQLLGKTTEQAIRLGVQAGAVEEVKGIINRFKQHYPDLNIVLTGGDASFFVKALKSNIFADPFLTLRGLNVILNYNADKPSR